MDELKVQSMSTIMSNNNEFGVTQRFDLVGMDMLQASQGTKTIFGHE